MTTLHSFSGLLRRLATLRLPQPDSSRNGCSYAVTLATPILPGRCEELRAILRSFDKGDGSPLARVRDVQFARWVVIDQVRTKWRHAPRRASSLRTQYLLFSADLTAPAYRAGELPNAFFRDIADDMRDACIAVWENCWEFPGLDDIEKFVSYLADSQVDIGLYYAAFPDATPSDIANALDVRRQLGEFAREHQDALSGMGPPPDSPRDSPSFESLQAEYVSRSAAWGA